MDIQKTVSSQSDETGVVLISLQYELGLLGHLHILFQTQNINDNNSVGLRSENNNWWT